MRLHRTICRVDYLVSFDATDRLGAHTQRLHDLTQVAPFKDVKCNLDILTRTATCEGTVDTRPFTLHLAPTNMDFTIEYAEGIAVERLGDARLFELLGELLPSMASKRQYERIGVRSLLIATSATLKFRPVLDLLLGRLGTLKEPLLTRAAAADIACIVEVDDNHGRHSRAAFGPYRATEWAKHFLAQPKLPSDEGMIFDVDTSITKMEVAKLDLRKFATAHQNMIQENAGGVISRIEGELK